MVSIFDHIHPHHISIKSKMIFSRYLPDKKYTFLFQFCFDFVYLILFHKTNWWSMTVKFTKNLFELCCSDIHPRIGFIRSNDRWVINEYTPIKITSAKSIYHDSWEVRCFISFLSAVLCEAYHAPIDALWHLVIEIMNGPKFYKYMKKCRKYKKRYVLMGYTVRVRWSIGQNIGCNVW